MPPLQRLERRSGACHGCLTIAGWGWNALLLLIICRFPDLQIWTVKLTGSPEAGIHFTILYLHTSWRKAAASKGQDVLWADGLERFPPTVKLSEKHGLFTTGGVSNRRYQNNKSDFQATWHEWKRTVTVWKPSKNSNGKKRNSSSKKWWMNLSVPKK